MANNGAKVIWRDGEGQHEVIYVHYHMGARDSYVGYEVRYSTVRCHMSHAS